MNTREKNALEQLPGEPGKTPGPFTAPKPGGLKVAHRCKIDRSKAPPTTSDDMIAIEGVPLEPELIADTVAVRVNGRWFVSLDSHGQFDGYEDSIMEQIWDEYAPPKPTVVGPEA